MKGEKTLDLDLSSAVDLTDEIHQVPCVVKLNGPAPVSDYFKPKLTGFVIGKKTSEKRKACDTDAETNDSWQVNAKFQNITFWNHDNRPSKEDAFLRAFQWFDLAKALHKPVTAEDIESAANPGATTTD